MKTIKKLLDCLWRFNYKLDRIVYGERGFRCASDPADRYYSELIRLSYGHDTPQKKASRDKIISDIRIINEARSRLK